MVDLDTQVVFAASRGQLPTAHGIGASVLPRPRVEDSTFAYAWVSVGSGAHGPAERVPAAAHHLCPEGLGGVRWERHGGGLELAFRQVVKTVFRALGAQGVAIGTAMFIAVGHAHGAPADKTSPLLTLVKSGHQPDLRWSEFPEFRSEVQRLYARAAWHPLWLSRARPIPAAMQLIARLAAADSLGLDPADYDAAWLDRQANALARFDLGLSVAAVRFVSALHRGRLSPHVMHARMFTPSASLAAEMAVDSLRDAGRQGSVLERLQPRVAKPGMRLRAAAQLRRLLAATGDLQVRTAPTAAHNGAYSADLVAAVKRFQTRQGFSPDGIIGPATTARLNRLFAERVTQIELALERFRWLPSSFPVPPIIVNIPAFRLYAFTSATDNEDDMLTMDVVVGGAFDKNTPVFAANMRYLIFRPYMHDTPAKGGFARFQRDASHSCIRLGDPVALAAYVLRDQPEWTVARIRTAMAGEDDTRVNLSGPVPVYVIYSTAYARENGEVDFYGDIYGLDGELERLLKAGYPYPS